MCFLYFFCFSQVGNFGLISFKSNHQEILLPSPTANLKKDLALILSLSNFLYPHVLLCGTFTLQTLFSFYSFSLTPSYHNGISLDKEVPRMLYNDCLFPILYLFKA